MRTKIESGLFAIFLGWLGIHKFYLGKWGWGLVYLLFYLLNLYLIPAVAGIVEGIIYLSMKEKKFQEKHVANPKPFKW